MDEKSKNIAKALTIFRIGNYHSGSCQNLLSKNDVLEVYALSAVLIAKLLRLPIIPNTNVLGKFGGLLEDFAVSRPEGFIFFSAQLLQYYTAMCDPKLEAQTIRLNKINYLQKGKHALGDINGNFLVLKYCAVLIYNYADELKQQLLSYSKEKHKDIINPIISDLKFIDGFVLGQLASLAKMQLAYPMQPYILYLLFIYNYVYISLIEVSFLCKLSRVDDDFYKLYLAKQATIVNTSMQLLDKLNTNCLSKKELEPFFLGRPPFSDFPITNYKDIKAHLVGLSDLA